MTRPRRRRPVPRLAAALAAAALAAPFAAGAEGDAAAAAAEAAVLERMAGIQRAAEAMDAEGAFRHVLDGDADMLIQDGRVYRTRAEALASTREGLARLGSVAYRFRRQRVTLLSPTAALVTAEGEAEATARDGTPFTVPFAQSVVLVQTDGQWMVLHAHRSTPREP